MTPTTASPGEIPSRTAAVVVGASAGAVEALLTLLPALPRGFTLPVIVVVHLPPDRPSLLPDLFAARCSLPVKEAEDKEPIDAGTVYLAPPDYHLLVEPGGTLALSVDAPVRYSRPSIDVLFESAADVWGPALVGVVLTGANPDGARGLRAICEAGGVALVQDPHEAQVPVMPQAALDACPAARALPLREISRALVRAATAEVR